jgi:hypothetical protein
MKRNLTIILIGLFGAIGFWFGEGMLQPWAVLPITVGVIGCLVVAFMIPGKPWLKTVIGVASLVLYVVGFFVGSISFSHAYNECVKRGEEVRVQLSEYHQKKGQYPERLNQFEGFGLCGRLIRPTVLQYERTSGGYVLSFKDWLVEHTATESEPFMAHK